MDVVELVGQGEGKLSIVESLIRSILFQVLRGLEEIREQCGCAHGRLVPDSIVLDPESTMTVVDIAGCDSKNGDIVENRSHGEDSRNGNSNKNNDNGLSSSSVDSGRTIRVPRIRIEGFGLHLLSDAIPESARKKLDFVPPERVLRGFECGTSNIPRYADDMWSCGVLVCELLGYRCAWSSSTSCVDTKDATAQYVRQYCVAVKRLMQRRRKSSSRSSSCSISQTNVDTGEGGASKTPEVSEVRNDPSMASVWLDEDLRRAVSPSLTEIVTDMLRIHQNARPCAASIVARPYFAAPPSSEGYFGAVVAEYPSVRDSPPSNLDRKEVRADEKREHIRTPKITMKSPAKAIPRSNEPRRRDEGDAAISFVSAKSGELSSLRSVALESESPRSRLLAGVRGELLAPFLYSGHAGDGGDAVAWETIYALWQKFSTRRSRAGGILSRVGKGKSGGNRDRAGRRSNENAASGDFFDPALALTSESFEGGSDGQMSLHTLPSPLSNSTRSRKISCVVSSAMCISLASIRSRCVEIATMHGVAKNAIASKARDGGRVRLTAELKSLAMVRRALVALPWSKPRLVAACGGSIGSKRGGAPTDVHKNLRQVYIPPSLRKQVWAALLGVNSIDPLRIESSSRTLSFPSARLRYASLVGHMQDILARERDVASVKKSERSPHASALIPLACQVKKDTRRCHQYIHNAQLSEMYRAATRIIGAWIVDDVPGRRGYWQGLSSVCVTFLLLYNMDEPTAFACFGAFVSRYLLPNTEKKNATTREKADKASSNSGRRLVDDDKNDGDDGNDAGSAADADDKVAKRTTTDASEDDEINSEGIEDGKTKLRTPMRGTTSSADVESAAPVAHNEWWKVQDRTLKRQLQRVAQIVGFHDAVLGARLETVGLQPDMFGLRWLLSTFAHVLPFRSLVLLWDAIIVRDCAAYVLCVTAAFVLVRRERFLRISSSSGIKLSLSGLMQQLTNMPGSKVALVDRTLRIANRLVSTASLWFDDDADDVDDEGDTSNATNPPPSCWTMPMRTSLARIVDVKIAAVAVYIGKSGVLASAFGEERDGLDVFRVSINLGDLYEMESGPSRELFEDRGCHRGRGNGDSETANKFSHLARFLVDQQNAWIRRRQAVKPTATSRSSSSQVAPTVLLIPVVAECGDGSESAAAATAETLGQWLVRDGINCVVVLRESMGSENYAKFPKTGAASLVAIEGK
eukprot:g2823.t1